MIRTLGYQPKLLREKHIIHFSSSFETGKVGELHRDKYYTIGSTQVVPYDLWRIIPRLNYVDIDLHNSPTTESIYPDDPTEIYEILMAFRGPDMLIYPIIPSPDWFFQKLGYTNMVPLITNTTRRYLGNWKDVDSFYDELEPEDTEMKIRFTFAKDLDALILRCYNDGSNAHEKMVMHLLINRCSLVGFPVDKEGKQIVPEEDKKVAREIKYHDELRRGRR